VPRLLAHALEAAQDEAAEAEEDVDGEAQRLAHALSALCTELHAIASRPPEAQSGATACLALLSPRVLTVATLGDVRALVLDAQWRVLAFSAVHEPLADAERLRIQRLGGWVSDAGRLLGNVAVARCIGSPRYQPYVSAVPQLTQLRRDAGAALLVLASDGLWDVLPVPQLCRLLQDSGRVLEGSAARLRDVALALGSGDNVSVLVVQL
jgi:serine/threonine protein phosphatase PrpC